MMLVAARGDNFVLLGFVGGVAIGVFDDRSLLAHVVLLEHVEPASMAIL